MCVILEIPFCGSSIMQNKAFLFIIIWALETVSNNWNMINWIWSPQPFWISCLFYGISTCKNIVCVKFSYLAPTLYVKQPKNILHVQDIISLWTFFFCFFLTSAYLHEVHVLLVGIFSYGLFSSIFIITLYLNLEV